MAHFHTFTRTLSNWRILLIIAIIGVLQSFSLNEKLSRDDHLHQAYINGKSLMPGSTPEERPAIISVLTGLYSFTGRQQEHYEAARQWGAIPWWSSPNLSLNFFRPLAALTHWFDYTLWPDRPELMHLQSVVWYLLILSALVMVLNQQGITGITLLLVLCIYGFDVGRSIPVYWISNRNILVATFFTLIAIWHFHQWRARANRQHAFWFVVFFLMSLLSAEAAVGGFAAFCAYLLFIEKSNSLSKVKAALVALLVMLAWRLTYVLLGFGANNNGMYLDPIKDPSTFVNSVIVNWPTLLLEQLTGIETFAFIWSDGTINWLVIGSLIFLLIVFLIWLPLLRARPLALFWFMTSLVATLPACAVAITGNRAMFLAGIGMTVVLAMFMVGIIRREEWVPHYKSYKWVAWTLVVLLCAGHLLGNTLGWAIVISNSMKKDRPIFNSFQKPLEKAVSETSTLIVVNAPVQFDFIYTPVIAEKNGLVVARFLRVLTPGLVPITVTRPSSHRLEIVTDAYFPLSSEIPLPQTGPQFHNAHVYKRADAIFLDHGTHYVEDQQFSVPGMTVTVSSIAGNGMPQRITVDFVDDLDANNLQWFYWDWSQNAYQDWTPPTIGEQISISGPFSLPVPTKNAIQRR